MSNFYPIYGTYYSNHPPYRADRNVKLSSSSDYKPIIAKDLINKLDVIKAYMLDELNKNGIAVINCNKHLETREFIDIAEFFGLPMVEFCPKIQTFVQDQVVLNINTVYDTTKCIEHQPFASNFISMHTENSLSPPEKRSSLLLFQCIDPPLPGSGGHTVLISINNLIKKLSLKTRNILEKTCYKGRELNDPILEVINNSYHLKFRDFMYEPLEWVYWSSSKIPNDLNIGMNINNAIENLLCSIYKSSFNRVDWRKGTIVLIDNTKFMHGRTAQSALKNSNRHLQRIRILTK